MLIEFLSQTYTPLITHAVFQVREINLRHMHYSLVLKQRQRDNYYHIRNIMPLIVDIELQAREFEVHI